MGAPHTPHDAEQMVQQLHRRLRALELRRPRGPGGSSTPDPGKFVQYDAAGRVQVADPAVDADVATKGYVNTSMPVGVSMMWHTATPPTDWLLLDGSTFNSATYPDLYAVLGTTTLPDMRGYAPVGHKAGDSSFGTLGGTTGSKMVTLTDSHMPDTDIFSTNAGTSEWRSSSGEYDVGSLPSGNFHIPIANSSSESGGLRVRGGNSSHPNVQPSSVVNFIIKAR